MYKLQVALVLLAVSYVSAQFHRAPYYDLDALYDYPDYIYPYPYDPLGAPGLRGLGVPSTTYRRTSAGVVSSSRNRNAPNNVYSSIPIVRGHAPMPSPYRSPFSKYLYIIFRLIALFKINFHGIGFITDITLASLYNTPPFSSLLSNF